MPFVDLGRKPGSEALPSPTKKNEIYYPSIYIDKDLGFDEKDVGKTKTATVRLKVKSVEKRISENKKRDTVSFDVLGIELRNSHYGKE